MGEVIKSLKDLKKEIEMNKHRQETAQEEEERKPRSYIMVDEWPYLKALVEEYGQKKAAEIIGLSPGGLAGQLGSDGGVKLYYEKSAKCHILEKELLRKQKHTSTSIFTIVATGEDADKIATGLELLHVEFHRRDV